MGIEIREVNLNRELPVVEDTFNANFRIKGSRDRFKWLYFSNPDGVATAWFAIDDRSGAIAGCTAVVPRRVRLKNSDTVVRAWTCSDFCINPAYRTMGVAIKLRRVARDAVEAGQSPFLYAHPNDRMLQVHLRVGHVPLGAMVRYAKPLRVRGGARWQRGATRLALGFFGRERLVRRSSDIEVSVQPPADVSAIYDRVAARIGTSVVRDHDYLAWRFGQHPLEPHSFLVVRAGGKPVAYAAYTTNDETAMIKDWLAVDGRARDQLFAGFISECRAKDIASISLGALESHPDLPALRWFGFVPRAERSTAITFAPPAMHADNAVRSPQSWYMTVGDRDM